MPRKDALKPGKKQKNHQVKRGVDGSNRFALKKKKREKTRREADGKRQGLAQQDGKEIFSKKKQGADFLRKKRFFP
ncbi:hypothetical protein JW826_05805 [Candidatus Woesearchaeota archaeon]|nr:hypothetical protein [Candidatus Woesearchaeota archaeon]